MSIRRSPRRLRTFFLAVLLVGTVLPASAAPVLALEACPSNNVPDHPFNIASWQTQYGPARGITLCRALNGFGATSAYVTIVDIAAGATLKILSDVAAGSTPGQAGTLFNKKYADEWWNFAGTVTWPSPALRFSVINGGTFFNDSCNSNPTTTFSFPQKTWGSIRSLGTLVNGGGDSNDPARNAPKRMFGFGSPSQKNFVNASFPTNYTTANVYSYFGTAPYPANWYSAIVGIPGYHDLYPGRPARRTMLGFNFSTNRIYILTTSDYPTLPQAVDILREFQTTDEYEIQLDGGGSTFMRPVTGLGIPSNGGTTSDCEHENLTQRKVPDTIAVYLAP